MTESETAQQTGDQASIKQVSAFLLQQKSLGEEKRIYKKQQYIQLGLWPNCLHIVLQIMWMSHKGNNGGR